jgi:DNA-binding MarR family transcriptional regulator
MSDVIENRQNRDFETSLHSEDKLELRVWLRLLTCSNLIEQQVRSGLRRDFETTLPRFDVLAQLERAPDGMTMGQLSSHLMVSNGNITGLIDRLVLEELVTRSPAPGDRRTQMVRLNDNGRAAFAEMLPVHEAWIVDLLSGVDREDMSRLLELLARLKGSLNNSLEKSSVKGDNG